MKKVVTTPLECMPSTFYDLFCFGHDVAPPNSKHFIEGIQRECFKHSWDLVGLSSYAIKLLVTYERIIKRSMTIVLLDNLLGNVLFGRIIEENAHIYGDLGSPVLKKHEAAVKRCLDDSNHINDMVKNILRFLTEEKWVFKHPHHFKRIFPDSNRFEEVDEEQLSVSSTGHQSIASWVPDALKLNEEKRGRSKGKAKAKPIPEDQAWPFKESILTREQLFPHLISIYKVGKSTVSKWLTGCVVSGTYSKKSVLEALEKKHMIQH